jgi:predicted Zn-dependent protease
MRKTIFAMLVVTLAASPAHAQLGSLMKKADSLAKAYDDWNFTDAEEHELGGEISTKLRDKYGVVQDKAVHKYVTLVGSVLAQQSSRPNCSGRSSCSTPTASTRLPRRAGSSTSRAARSR